MRVKDIDQVLAEYVVNDGYGYRDATYKKRIKGKPVKEQKSSHRGTRKWQR